MNTYESYEHDMQADPGTPEPRDLQSDVTELRGEVPRRADAAEDAAETDRAAQQTGEKARSPQAEAGGFFKSLGRSIERNPVPLAMIAGGVGYLIYNELRARKQSSSPHTSLSERVDAVLERETGASAPGAISRARELVHDVEEEVGAVAGRVGSAARELSHDASSFASRAADTAREAARKGQDIILERPLVLAGLGIAFGAALAGTAPMSRREQELLAGPAGEAIDSFINGAQQLKERAKGSAGALGDAVKHEASVLMSSTEQVGDQDDLDERMNDRPSNDRQL